MGEVKCQVGWEGLNLVSSSRSSSSSSKSWGGGGVVMSLGEESTTYSWTHAHTTSSASDRDIPPQHFDVSSTFFFVLDLVDLEDKNACWSGWCVILRWDIQVIHSPLSPTVSRSWSNVEEETSGASQSVRRRTWHTAVAAVHLAGHRQTSATYFFITPYFLD